MRNLAVLKLIAALLLAFVGVYYFRSAERLCQRFAKGEDTAPKTLRWFLYPDWFYKSGLCQWQFRSAGVTAVLMSVFLIVLTFLSPRFRR